MPKPLEVNWGKWWRFDRYEIRDGYIRPAKGATCEAFDPWDEYRKSLSKRGTSTPPYRSLLVLASELAPEDTEISEVLTPDSQRKVTEWCSHHGLLGVLLHRAQWVVLPARWVPNPDGPNRRRLVPIQDSFILSGHRWVTSTSSSVKDIIAPPGTRSGSVVRGTLAEEFEPPRVLMRDEFMSWDDSKELLRDESIPTWKMEPLTETWARFFPSVPKAAREQYDYPPPLTEAFFRLYAEPVEEFIGAVVRLQRAIEFPSERILTPGMAPDEIVDELRDLRELISHVSPIPVVLTDGTLSQRWAAPSLLASLAMMAFQDMTTERRMRHCGNHACGNVFVTRSPQGLYCSPRCRRTVQMRATRQHKKEREAQ